MSEMHLIMENWRSFSIGNSFVLNEQVGAPTVGAVIEAINLYSLAQQSPWRKSIQTLIEIIGDQIEFADAADITSDTVTDLVEGLVKLAETIEKDGILSGAALKLLFSTATIKVLKNPQILNALGIRAKAMGLTANINEVLTPVLNLFGVAAGGIPLGTLAAGAKFIWAAARGAKKVKGILGTSKDPEAAFEKTIEAIMNAPDNKDTTSGYLALFNIDDKWQEMLDDKIDAEFIKYALERLKAVSSADSNIPITAINFNSMLVNWLKQNHDGRHLGGSPLAQAGAAQ